MISPWACPHNPRGPSGRVWAYGLAGEPICLDCWAMIRADVSFRAVCRTEIRRPRRPWRVSVSTVWLGLDHNYGDGPPLIFETLVFGGPMDQQDAWRYPTWRAAAEGHQRVVELVLLDLAASVSEPGPGPGYRPSGGSQPRTGRPHPEVS